MKVVGITGRSGCGKSSATNFLREKGYPCVARICARDGIAPEMARRRLDAQTPLETLRAAATAELVNDSTPDALREKLRSVLNGLEKEGTCQKPKSEKEAF